MVLTIDIPEGSKVKQDGDRLFIIFDEHKTKRDLWLASLYIWLTKGNSPVEFYKEKLLSCKRLEISNHNTLKLSTTK